MKKLLAILTIAVVAIISCKTKKPAAEVLSDPKSTAPFNFSEQSTWLLGYINPSQFLQYPHSEWYTKGFNEYQAAPDAITELSSVSKDDLSITVVLGTWCPDSRREVPRFMKVLDNWRFPVDSITFIGVDNTKTAPVWDYEKLGIERVPTFIFMKNKVEAGRIIENPQTSLEQDMINILRRNEK